MRPRRRAAAVAEAEVRRPRCVKYVVVASLNVQNLAGTLGAVLQSAVDNNVDILCVQEPYVTMASRAGVRAQAFKSGYAVHFGDHVGDARERCLTLTLSRVDLDVMSPPKGAPVDPRVQYFAVPRQCRRPMVLANLYAHATDKEARQRITEGLLLALRQYGDDALVMGDYNVEPEDEAVGRARANGVAHLIDESFEAGHAGTSAANRAIDFGMAIGDVWASERIITDGPRDHKMIQYNLNITVSKQDSLATSC